MPENLTRASYAGSILRAAYDVSSCGIGVQRQLVTLLVNDPSLVRASDYLERALLAGTGSNLIVNAKTTGKDVFQPGDANNVKAMLQSLGHDCRDFEHSVLGALAGADYAQARSIKLSLHEAVGLFTTLAGKYYFSRPPSRRAVERYLMYGMGMEFAETLGREGVKLDHQRLFGDMEEVMLDSARKGCVEFHSGKLTVMRYIVNLADLALAKEAGASGYSEWLNGLKQDTRLTEKWKELFDEGLPMPDALISSSRKAVEEANAFLGLRRGP